MKTGVKLENKLIKKASIKRLLLSGFELGAGRNISRSRLLPTKSRGNQSIHKYGCCINVSTVVIGSKVLKQQKKKR